MITLIPKKGDWMTFLGTPEQHQEMTDRFLSDSATVPMKDTFGKYCFDSKVIYPRYKIKNNFETYNEGKLAKRAIAKNEKYANYIVYETSAIKEILKHARIWRDPDTGILHKEYRYLTKTKIAILEHAYELTTTYKHVKIIEADEFLKEMSEYKDRLSLRDSEMLLNLLKGDDAAHKLGMEMMTNYDVQKSILALIHVTKNGRSLDSAEYFNSTAFKSFRKEFERYTNMRIESIKYSGQLSYVFERIGLKHMYMDEFEQKVIKLMYVEYLKTIVKKSQISLNLDESNIFLDIPEDHLISTAEEPIKP